jgi:Caudovirus prohead serine protease
MGALLETVLPPWWVGCRRSCRPRGRSGSAAPLPVELVHLLQARGGSVEPQTMAETDEGLHVEGQLDLETSEVAREAWRSMKADRVALSFGYMVTADFKREDGVRELLGIDLFEISIVPAPANPDTRIVSMKSADTSPFTADEWKAMFFPAERKTTAQKDAELLEVAERFEREEARRARKARPIRQKTFKC